MKSSPRSIPPLIAGCLTAFQLLALVAGCSSTQKTPSSRLASVVVGDRRLDEIENTTEKVFQANGYETARHLSGEFVFEKKGTESNTLIYGDWSEKAVWVRVKLFIRRLEPSREVLLECDAYMVNERGDARFEEEHKLTWMHRGRYQSLLEQVGTRLK